MQKSKLDVAPTVNAHESPILDDETSEYFMDKITDLILDEYGEGNLEGYLADFVHNAVKERIILSIILIKIRLL